jgi:hypothetical protein
MRSTALSFLRQIRRWSLTHGPQELSLCGGTRQEFPRALALERALREALVARGPQQAATSSAEAACACGGGPRHARHGIAMEQAGPLAPADRVEVQTTRREGWRDLGQPEHRVKRATQVARAVCRAQGVRGGGFEEGRKVAEPCRTLLSFLGGLRTGGQRRLATLRQLDKARRRALCQQVETHAGHVREPLVGLHPSQSQGRPAFAGAQRADGAKALGEDRIRFGLWHWEGLPRRGALGGGRCGLCERPGPQASHRQDACVAGRRAGFLTEHVAALLGPPPGVRPGCAENGPDTPESDWWTRPGLLPVPRPFAWR